MTIATQYWAKMLLCDVKTVHFLILKQHQAMQSVFKDQMGLALLIFYEDH